MKIDYEKLIFLAYSTCNKAVNIAELAVEKGVSTLLIPIASGCENFALPPGATGSDVLPIRGRQLAPPLAVYCCNLLKWLNVLMKVRDVIKRLQDDGWYLARTKGSHRQFIHPTKLGLVTVPGKLFDDLAVGTLSSIWRQAQLK